MRVALCHQFAHKAQFAHHYHSPLRQLLPARAVHQSTPCGHIHIGRWLPSRDLRHSKFCLSYKYIRCLLQNYNNLCSQTSRFSGYNSLANANRNPRHQSQGRNRLSRPPCASPLPYCQHCRMPYKSPNIHPEYSGQRYRSPRHPSRLAYQKSLPPQNPDRRICHPLIS